MNAPLRFLTAITALTASLPAFAQPITAVLRLKEKVSLEKLAQDVRDPSSPRFGNPYTPEEIRAISGPSTEAYLHLLAQLRASGIEVTSESETHLWISVKADSSVFERVFGARFEFVSPERHKNLAPVRMPSRLPLVASVVGLDNTRKARPLVQRPSRLDSAPGGIQQATIKSAYGFDPLYKAGWTGKGQHIAIATYDGFNIDDVKHFYSVSHLSPGPSIDQVKYNGEPKFDEGSAMETELDAEFSGMMAPGASIHVFASATNDDPGELQMFTAILDDNRAKIANYSWGDCETHIKSEHVQEMAKVFARAVAQGVNIMVASGDSGSDSCQDSSTIADWPAANPNVVAVGGTTFRQSSGKIADTAWSGSGGGISALWDLPQWQSSLGTPYVKRSYPDVAFNADPFTGQAIWTHQGGREGWATIGGTSMAAPQWSGFMALVNEARLAKGKSALGFLNPVIYGLQDRAKLFNDVTSGSNGAYKAAAGWDAVTGFGSMQADALLELLAGF
jgi:kumamolisin